MTRYLLNDTKLQNEILEEGNDMMKSNHIQLGTKSFNCYFVLVSDYCGKPVTHPSKDEFTAPYIWSFYHAFFFSFTVCSTVGNINILKCKNDGYIYIF